MKVSIFSGVTGLKSKAVGAGMWGVIVCMLGWINVSSEIGSVALSWATFA